MKKENFGGWMIAVVGVLFTIFANIAYSHEYHHIEPDYRLPTNNYQVGSKGIALASASGQHNYKATNQLQWSIAGAFVGENDDSAASFGLAKQLGKVFVSGIQPHPCHIHTGQSNSRLHQGGLQE